MEFPTRTTTSIESSSSSAGERCKQRSIFEKWKLSKIFEECD